MLSGPHAQGGSVAWHSHGGAALLQPALDKCWPPRRQRVKDQALPAREMKPKYPLLLRGEVTLFSACTAGSCPGKDDSLRSPPGLTVGLAGYSWKAFSYLARAPSRSGGQGLDCWAKVRAGADGSPPRPRGFPPASKSPSS